MNELKVYNLGTTDNFKFNGFDQGVLEVLNDECFVVRSSHSSKEYIQYNFEYNAIEKINKSDFKKSTYSFDKSQNIDSTITNKKAKNVIELPCSSSKISGTFDFQIYHEDHAFIKENVTIPKISKCEYWHWENYCISRWNFSKNLFEIINGDNMECAVFIADSKHQYASSNLDTRIFIINCKNILIWNNGNFPSVIYIQNFNELFEIINPTQEQIEEEAKNIFENVSTLTGSIYKFIESLVRENIDICITDDKKEQVSLLSGKKLFDVTFDYRKGELVLTSENNGIFNYNIESQDIDEIQSFINSCK